MTDTNAAELPLETTVGAAGPHATDAFALLGDETRLAILLAVWEEYDPHAIRCRRESVKGRSNGAPPDRTTDHISDIK